MYIKFNLLGLLPWLRKFSGLIYSLCSNDELLYPFASKLLDYALVTLHKICEEHKTGPRRVRCPNPQEMEAPPKQL